MKSGMKDTLLLVGNETSDRSELHKIFEPQYYLLEAENAAQGILLLQQSSSCIAAVLADIPLTDGKAVHALVAATNPNTENEIPILFLVAADDAGQQEASAFLLGATDVVLKPYALPSIQRRLQVLVDLYHHRWHLESLVAEQNQAIRSNYQTILDTMSSIIEQRSMDSGNHVLRLRGFVKILLQEVAVAYPEYKLTPEIIDCISAATALHDIGKIVIPDAILNKPGPLTPEEFAIMKEHTTLGGELITKLSGTGEALYLHYAYNICLYHHERWDGSGYPKGLKGDEIPICAQVAGIADAFDALTSQRVYKPAISHQAAVNMILNGDCGAFSPHLLECFKRAYNKFVDLTKQIAEEKEPSLADLQAPLPGPDMVVYSLDALQTSQLKYQTLLHYLNDTVIELDLDNHVYHVVHSPNPDLAQIIGNKEMGNHFHSLMQTRMHTEDAEMVVQMRSVIVQKLFVENQRMFGFQCRLFNPYQNRYDPYQVTLLRIHMPNPAQRVVLAVFHIMDTQVSPASAPARPFAGSAHLFESLNVNLYCLDDKDLTIKEGSGALLKLTGHLPMEITRDYQDSFIRMVHPDDRDALLSRVKTSGRGTDQQEITFRLQHNTGKTVWVLGKFHLHISPYNTQYICFSLTDISSVMAAQQNLSKDYYRNQLIVQQFKNIIVEWNLQTDELVCAENWKDRFGYDLNITKFSRILDGVSNIHPDDLPNLRKKLLVLKEREGKDVMDLRIADREGRYVWSRIRAVSQANGQEKPTTIVAVIYNINDLKQDALVMKRQAEQDALTKLLNKASTQQAVTEYLAGRTPDSLAALMILDVDNFKVVNDQQGHMYGDAVLSQISASLRNLFRSRDIIGRVGGDEFLVLLKDLPNVEIVHERCALMVDFFQQMLHNLMPELPVSISVGCALAPSHGNTWSELFQHADEALYGAKNKGKCQYKIYNPQDSYQALVNPISRTQIDSDEQPSLNDDTLVRQVFHNLYASRDLDGAIKDVLAFVGAMFNVSRVYIFENNSDNTHCSNTFEWCNAGIEPQIEFLQDVCYEEDVPSWQSSFNENGILYSSDISQLPPDLREILEPQGIKSLLHCAIMDQGVFRGVVGFDECNNSCLWTQGQISLLQFLAEVLSVFLLKRRN